MFKLFKISIIISLLALCSCASQLKPWQKAELSYKSGDVKAAEAVLLPMEKKIKDNNYPLNLLSLGTIQLNYGDYQKAQSYFNAAIANMQIAINGVEVSKQILKSETGRLYRGFSHERTLAHMYLGLTYLQMNQFEDATIEFAKVRESDVSKKTPYNNDFCISHFLDGMNALYSKNYQDASVSFRKVNELKPEFALGWYGLFRASVSSNDLDEAEKAWGKYELLTSDSERLNKDGSEDVVMLLIDGGFSPDRKPDALLGQFAKWSHSDYSDSLIKIYTENSKEYSAYPVSDIYFQATTAGGFDEDLKKKVVSVAAKETLKKYVPFIGLFLGNSEADIRSWSIAPGQLHVAVIPLKDKPSSLKIKAYNNNNAVLPVYNQTLYYLKGKTFEQPNIVYIRIIPNADYREI